jgi:predicted transposase YbfD/YdcC
VTGFPGLEMILRVDSEVKKSGVETTLETRYFVASLDADQASPKRLMGAVRGHWGVENRLHFLKDRWWDEDRQWSTRPGLAERLATLRDGALAALRLIPGLPDDLSIRGRADHLSRRLRKALKFIGALK